jgi:hypothetical protein
MKKLIPDKGKLRPPKDEDEWLGFVAQVAVDRRIPSVKRSGQMREFPPHGAMTQRGVWIPFPDECGPCCENIHSWQKGGPKHPFMLYRHCCTLTHIATVFDVDKKALRKVVHVLEGQAKLLPKSKKADPPIRRRRLPRPEPERIGPWHPYPGPTGQKVRKVQTVPPEVELVPF